ncbi:MAG TPA: FadR family transcriptional regulator [Candidatus Microbacterium stercoravium]|uniref:FadR family transcriptional regulator n=1 Tax=Candidatus Microbacterium stercoravium TaxID=2838697 RepID=A0A9D2KGP2_9MICO|nr:FadR family transcriptional regulator [Candidatus Microbacterium stercoravium]
MAGDSSSSEQIVDALGTLPTGTPVSEVARRLLDLFTSGSIEPGTRLPSERQLAASLAVGRSAVREALAALEILGIVQVRPGSGTFLRGQASELLPQTLRWGLLIGERNTSELLELRSGLEIYVARIAATRADASAREAMRAHVRAMREAEDDLAAFARADLAFHLDIAEAADNGTLHDLLHVVRSLLQVHADRAVHSIADAEIAAVEHEAVLDALDAGDPDAAASAMAVHMITASERVTRLLTE